jgi:hypothetical protein
MSRYIVKGMNLKMSKRLIIWDRGSNKIDSSMLPWQQFYFTSPFDLPLCNCILAAGLHLSVLA